MTYGDGRPSLDAAKLNTVAIGFGSGRRRIDRLRQLAHDCNLSDSDARAFGKLTKTSTWEALLTSHGLEFEPRINTLEIASQESSHQIGLTDWIDWSQALALALASVGFALLILGMFPRINPLNLFPVKITIQVGK